ncbi:MAG: V-type ATP synthase subunit I, partial [Kiritimatiellia bacterium]
DFDPALVRALAEKGIIVRLFFIPGRNLPAVPAGARAFVIGRDTRGMRVVLIGPPDLPFAGQEFPLPSRSLSAIRSEISALRAENEAIESDLQMLSEMHFLVEARVAEAKQQLQYLEAAAGMGAHGPLVYLQGFCPANRVDEIRQAAAMGWGLVIADPAPDDPVPTLIYNPPWIRPIEALFRVIQILPGYHEVDVSASFLVFMSIFFAMIVSDAGYGLAYLALTFWARRRFRKAPPEPFRLLTIFSLCTIIWGMLVGSYFGVNALGPLRVLKVQWLDNYHNVMYLCLLLGALHLSVAHLWNILRMLNSTRAIAQFGWLSVTWSIFFVANTLLLDRPFPSWYLPIGIVGLLALVVFMTPWNKLKSEWVGHLMLPLTLMSNFGDILSYLRLFALGVAGVQLASAFNSMATTIGFSNPLRAAVAALIIFAGHALNIVLSVLSVFVHGIRLNALEFSTHFGLEWKGVPYQPFGVRRSERQ